MAATIPSMKPAKPVKPGRPRVATERGNPAEASRALWAGLLRHNRAKAGPFRYSRRIISARNASGKIVGGAILQSYWKETYLELLWLSEKARGQGVGSELIREAERQARRRGSALMHLNTYSFQAPGFYEKLGYRRIGAIRGSPEGASRYFYAKRL
jgi:GNAT superfamily N-acetyltransferase